MEVIKNSVKRILNTLQITEEGLIESQVKKVVNHYNDVIQDAKDQKEDTEKIYNRNLRNAEEELKALIEEEALAFDMFDISRCKKRDESKAYVFDLDKQFDIAINKVKAHKKAMADNKVAYETKIKQLDEVIENAAYKLSRFVSEEDKK